VIEPKKDELMRAPDVADLDPYNQRGKPKHEAAKELLEDSKEEKVAKERLKPKQPYRIVVLGSRLSGGLDLGSTIYDYLLSAGAKDPSTRSARDVDAAESAFFGVVDLDTSTKDELSVPTGVVLLPEMRQYSPSREGMTIPSYESGFADMIRKLCEENDVPLFEIHEMLQTPEAVTEKTEEILKEFNLI